MGMGSFTEEKEQNNLRTEAKELRGEVGYGVGPGSSLHWLLLAFL